MRAFLLALLMLVGACATQPAPAADPSGDSLDAIARDYVALILEIGEREPGYVDAYYGPAEWQAAATASPRTVPQLIQGAAGLTERLNAVSTRGAEPAVAQRRAYLLAHVSAASARLRMLSGEKMSFADEAEALFGIRPELRPLESYDPVLAEIDALLPGAGTLTDRVTAFRADYVIPRDRLQVVMDAAIAECRARTVRHITLPANERFALSFVSDKPWSGYNYYLGDAASRIEINADLPIYTERAIDLGCHEAYPGHHVYNALLEQTFVRERGWVEMSVYPLFSPMSFVAEGSANYGIDLAFPGDEATAYERDVLFPLAGLDPATAGKKAQLAALTRRLARAEYTIADDWLAGRIEREEAIRRLMKYTLATEARANQRLRFIDTYRSYIINYGLGRDVVQAWVERQGPDRWESMEMLLSSQILPTDLD
ncbi:MAG: hypothetical protein M3Q74_01165 [Pseudomonadota bacterium]|nr:hypothetical protein [Pseudomonadota bacterium]